MAEKTGQGKVGGEGLRLGQGGILAWWRSGWVVLALTVLGLLALVTAVLVAWPALAYIAARFF